MTPDGYPPSQFATTRWDLVLTAADKSDRPTQCLRAEDALNELCSIYWGPIVEFCRLQLKRRDAEDIAQAFLVEMARGEFLSRVDRNKGKFRTVMLAALKRFVFDLLDREKALKRGGDVEIEALPDDLGTGLVEDERGISADVCFDMAWAKVLVDRALDQLQKAYLNRQQSEAFQCLRPFLTSKAAGADAENAALTLRISVSELHVRIHRFAKECGELLRQEVARTVDAPHEIESELRYLVDLLSQSKWSS